MKVTVKIRVLEENGTETKGVKAPELQLASHWNHNDILGWVVLTLPDSRSFTVPAQVLKKAVDACIGIR